MEITSLLVFGESWADFYHRDLLLQLWTVTAANIAAAQVNLSFSFSFYPGYRACAAGLGPTRFRVLSVIHDSVGSERYRTRDIPTMKPGAPRTWRCWKSAENSTNVVEAKSELGSAT